MATEKEIISFLKEVQEAKIMDNRINGLAKDGLSGVCSPFLAFKIIHRALEVKRKHDKLNPKEILDLLDRGMYDRIRIKVENIIRCEKLCDRCYNFL